MLAKPDEDDDDDDAGDAGDDDDDDDADDGVETHEQDYAFHRRHAIPASTSVMRRPLALGLTSSWMLSMNSCFQASCANPTLLQSRRASS